MDAKPYKPVSDINRNEEKRYTVEDIFNLPEGQRAELINGRWYDMSAPSGFHQEIVMAIAGELRDYVRSNGGKCKVLPAPYAVFLNKDRWNYLEPDVSVICDRSKMEKDGCHGAPDLVVEVTSTSTMSRDFTLKLFKYREAGVREYWIINPDTRVINTFVFSENEEEEKGSQMTFDDELESGIFEGFKIVLSDLL